MKKNLFLSITGLLVVISLVFNINLNSKNNSDNMITLNNIERLASAEVFTFNGQDWNDYQTHWFGTDWRPVLVACFTTFDGHKVECGYGLGNCGNGTPCQPD